MSADLLQLSMFAAADYTDQVEQAVRDFGATHEVFQIFDAISAAGLPDPDDVQHSNGAITAGLKARRVIVAVGFEPSRRPRTAGSAVRTWTLARPIPGQVAR